MQYVYDVCVHTCIHYCTSRPFRSRSPLRTRDRRSRGEKSNVFKFGLKPDSKIDSPKPELERKGLAAASTSEKEASSSGKPLADAKKRDGGERKEAEGKNQSHAAKADAKKETSIEAVQAEQKRIEEEMKRRREKMEAWRAQRQKEEEEAKARLEEEEEEKKQKGWSLEDDEDDDEEEGGDDEEEGGDGEEEGGDGEEMETENGEAEDTTKEDVDPLDAFMVGVNEEVRQIRQDDQKKAGAKLSTKKGSAMMITVTKMMGKTVRKNKKGELLHNDQDAVEYSEEEEGDDELASALLTIAKKTKRKELPAVDHKSIEYQPFRKNFYVEVPELAKMTPAEVNLYRVELENIKVKGKDCPKPVKTWAQCGLSAKILDIMKKSNYERPTPIQAQAIPAIMSGRDLIGIAKTGSGKTLAFLLPMLRHVMDQPPLDYDDGPIVVILTPTRELAIQIYNECKKFCKTLKLRPVCVYGGTGISDQIADLKRGCEIVVCTPGRMIDMLAANSGRVTNFRRTTYVVLDEADRMFDMGFEPQVMKIISNVRPDKQTVMFSATFPRQMEALARKMLSKPIEVQVGGRSVVCKDVEQSVILIEEHQKFFKLLELLGIYQEKGSVLAFVEKQESADMLIRDLMKNSYPCMALHGGMDQFDRDSTIADFKNGAVKLLVATSVAARGLDVKQLILVVNFDCPNHYEDYVHRCGRTGRAGNKGNAYTFITPEQQRYAGDIIKALELSGASVPPELLEMWKTYTDKLKAEGKLKTSKRRAIGFTGKGYKFDEAEATRNNEAKLKRKSALGLANSDDEDEFALLTMDKKLEEVFSGKVKVRDPNAPQLPTAQRPPLLPTPGASKSLAVASAIADKILLSKNLVIGGSMSIATQEAASSVMKGGGVNITGATLASQIAATINAKVGAGPAKASDAYLPVGVTIPGQEGSDDGKNQLEQQIRYEEEIEINSFPQQIRFRITTREVLDDIGEYSEAYITVRGLYVPESRQPKEGEKRLYLAIEAKSERAVSLAKQEIKRVIKEEAQRMASRVHSHPKSGRYSVV